MISVYGGVRYVTAKNSYVGHMKDITVTTASTSLRADKFMTDLATQATAGAAQLNGAATGVGSFASIVGQTTTFDDAIAAISDPTQKAQITGLRDGLTNLGIANAGSMQLAVGQGTYTAYANGYTAQAGQLKAGATLTADQEADVEQTGSGICPILGVNLSLLEKKLNIGLKYEFLTKMEVKNKTTKDVLVGYSSVGAPIYMFPDGEKIDADMPALISLGISYKVIEKLNVSGGYYYYFDKDVSYGKRSPTTGEYLETNESLIDNNFMDITFGLEYTLNEKLLLSAGVLYGKTGVKPEYNSDLSYSNSSTTIGFGGKYSFSPKVALNLGVAYTKYEKATKTIGTIEETYLKDTWIFGIGFDINL
jgi:long-subunit fatty acid transport protein